MVRFLSLIVLSFSSILLCGCNDGEIARKDAETKRLIAEVNHSEAEAHRFQAAAKVQEQENRTREIQMQDKLQQAVIDQSKYLVIFAILGIIAVVFVVVFLSRKNNSFDKPKVIINDEKLIPAPITRQLQHNQKIKMVLTPLKQGKIKHYNEEGGWGILKNARMESMFFSISLVFNPSLESQ